MENHPTQELQPKGRDIREEELGDMVDKEMAATSAAIEEAVRRIDVSQLPVTKHPQCRGSNIWTDGLTSVMRWEDLIAGCVLNLF